ncbi:MAG: hypothetical protein KA248_00885 [Kiritimatiellae bacterium]|nr:hypothetical protein [Kiritimatiellia bacterium]
MKNARVFTCLGLVYSVALVAAFPADPNFYTVQHGSWHDTATWTNPTHLSGSPGAGAHAHVSHSILVTGNVTVAACSVDGGALTIDTGAMMRALEGTGTWQNARFGGGGSFLNQGHLIVTSMAPSEISGRFMNQGEVTFVQTPSCRLDGLFHNATQGVTTVGASPTNLFTMQGTGSFHNAGTFSVHQGTTSAWPQASFHNWGGSVYAHSAGVVCVESSFGTNYGGNYQLDTDALYHMRTGTNWFGGTTTVQGAGAMVLQSGQAVFFGSTSAVLNAQGGGFHWLGGGVSSTQALVNYGSMLIGGPGAWTQALQGVLYNSGEVTVRGETASALRVSGVISNLPSGRITMAGTNPAIIGQGFANLYNRGSVTFAGMGTSSVHVSFYQYGGTSVFRSGKTSLPVGQLYDGLVLMDGGTWGGNLSFLVSGGQLAGTGAITRALYHSGGLVSPGQSAGRLEIQDNYTQVGTNPALRMELAGAEPGASYDQLWISLTGRISGALTVELLGGYEPPPGARFDLVRAFPLEGLFAATNLPALPGDRFWLLRYLSDAAQLRVATPGDTDGDGLADDWELRFFDDLDGSDGGDDNFDDDPFVDSEEYVADTDPKDSNDVFRVIGIESGPPVVVHFEPGSTGRVYSFQFTDELAGGAWNPVPGAPPRPGAGGPDEMTDTNGAPARYHRVVVELP